MTMCTSNCHCDGGNCSWSCNNHCNCSGGNCQGGTSSGNSWEGNYGGNRVGGGGSYGPGAACHFIPVEGCSFTPFCKWTDSNGCVPNEEEEEFDSSQDFFDLLETSPDGVDSDEDELDAYEEEEEEGEEEEVVDVAMDSLAQA